MQDGLLKLPLLKAFTSCKLEHEAPSLQKAPLWACAAEPVMAATYVQ